MSHIVSFDDGEILDLDTAEGAYRHVGRFLRKNGADSKVFASLGKLFPRLRVPENNGPLTPSQRVDRLFDKNEFPTWKEIFDVICDAEFDTLNFRGIVAKRHGYR